ncbi:hypothetical protein KAI12_03480 [Candidatus Bathyarchaeota archaeon]|nr:hypothetical protein [Candidatus Bathyarchaeota archaeon]
MPRGKAVFVQDANQYTTTLPVKQQSSEDLLGRNGYSDKAIEEILELYN